MKPAESKPESANRQRLVRTIELGGAAALLGAAIVIVRHRETAEDVVQETYEKALKRLDRFRGDSAMETWLHRIAINTAIDTYHRQNRLKMTDEGHEIANSTQADTLDPEAILIEKESRQRVVEMIDRVSPSYREEFRLFLEGYSIEEIADMNAKPKNTVKVNIHRAKKQLRSFNESET